MMELNKPDYSISEIVRRLERLEKQTDGFNERACNEIDTLKLAVDRLTLGFSVIRWLAGSVLGTGITVAVTFIVERGMHP